MRATAGTENALDLEKTRDLQCVPSAITYVAVRQARIAASIGRQGTIRDGMVIGFAASKED